MKGYLHHNIFIAMYDSCAGNYVMHTQSDENCFLRTVLHCAYNAENKAF